MTATKRDIDGLAKAYGVTVETMSPGDGIRRYQFEIAGRRIHTSLGVSEAYEYISGFADGARHGANVFPEGRRNPPSGRTDNPPPEHVFSDEDFGVFLWREDGRYDIADSVGNYKRQSAAETFAEKLNKKRGSLDGGYVVRTLKYCRRSAQ